jgi:hypothetical protein
LERKYDKAFGVGKYDRIKFYRDWVAHAKLDRTSYKIFPGIDALIKAEMNKLNAVGHLDWQNQMSAKIRECFRDYGPLLLREDILSFFVEIDYVGKFNWESFRTNLYEVIRDTPLIIKDGDDTIFEFKCVKPFTKLNYDDLALNVVIKNDIFSFTLDDRSI